MNDRVRTSVFYLLAVVLVWAVVEIAAIASHAVLDGRLFSPRAIRDQAWAVAAGSPRAAGSAAGSPAATGESRGRWSEVIHPYFGVVIDPDRRPEGAISELGFVGGAGLETLTRKPPGTLVIGIFGGSFAAAIHQRSVARDVEQRLDQPATTVNFAKGGYKQPQQLMILAYLLALGVELDAVVNIDGFNEVALPPVENHARGVHPFYPRQWHLKARSVLDPETVRRVGYLGYLESLRSRRASWLLDRGLHRSAVLSLVWRAIDRRLAAKAQDARRQVDEVDAERSSFKLVRRSWACLESAVVEEEVVESLGALSGRVFDRAEQLHEAVVSRVGADRAARHRESIERCAAKISASYAVYGPKYVNAGGDGLYRDLAGMWRRSSFEMQALCAAHGVRYYHFLQPNQYLEGSKPITSEERRIAINPAQSYRPGVVRGYPLLRESGRELIERGVAFIDLTMIFEESSEVLYADDCCHLNSRGYDRVLDRILETLAADL